MCVKFLDILKIDPARLYVCGELLQYSEVHTLILKSDFNPFWILMTRGSCTPQVSYNSHVFAVLCIEKLSKLV